MWVFSMAISPSITRHALQAIRYSSVFLFRVLFLDPCPSSFTSILKKKKKARNSLAHCEEKILLNIEDRTPTFLNYTLSMILKKQSSTTFQKNGSCLTQWQS